MMEIDPDYYGRIFTLHSPFDNILIRGRHWPVNDNLARAVLLVVHGSGEHCQRYAFLAHYFNAFQIACVSFDWRGHGESGGERGFVPSIKALYDDLEFVIAHIRTDLQPDLPLIIYSHGTGSLICLSHIVRRPQTPLNCQAMIISTPSICLRRRPTALLLFFSRAFANLNAHFLLPIEGNYNNVYTNDPSIVEAYRKDPLVHDRWPAMTISIFMELGVLLEKNTVQPSCPLLIQHGGADTVTPLNGIREWFQNRVQGEAEFKEWPENLHELHNDLNREEILDHAVRWIETKLRFN